MAHPNDAAQPLQESDAEDGAPVPATEEKLTDWAREPSIQELKQDVEGGQPAHNLHMSRVNTWLDNLNVTGSAKFTPVKGRSGVQPRLIRKQAEWRYTSLSEPFLSSDQLFKLKPVSWEDREACLQNEILLNWQFDTKINKVHFVDQFVHTVVDEGTVAVRVGWKQETGTRTIEVPEFAYFPIQDEQGMQVLQQAAELEQANPNEFKGLPPELQESVRYSQEQGQPLMAQITRMVEAEEEYFVFNHPTVEVIDINNLVVDPSCNGDAENAKFMSYTYEISRGELENNPQRYKNLDKVNWGHSPLAEPDYQTETPPEFNFKDKVRKLLPITEYWGLYDITGTGLLEPIVAAWVGETLVRMERSPFPDKTPPFVIIPYTPIRRSIFGEPDGELLVENQKIAGALTRGVIDSLARSANGQRGMAKNMLDVTNKRRFDSGQDYEFNPQVHPANGMIEHKYPEIPGSVLHMLSYQNQEAESYTGVKTYDGGLTGDALGATAAGAKGVMAASAKRETGILRRLARGMATIGRKIVAMNQEFLSEEEVIRVTNEEFIKIRREDLGGSFDMTVQVTTAEEDNLRASELGFMLQTMGPHLDIGMTKMLLVEVAKLRRMPDLAKSIKDYEPQPDPIEEKKRELEVRELEAKVQKIEAEAAEAMARAELAMAKTRDTHGAADHKTLDYVEQETGTKHARDLQRIGEQGAANERLEVTRAQVRLAEEALNPNSAKK